MDAASDASDDSSSFSDEYEHTVYQPTSEYIGGLDIDSDDIAGVSRDLAWIADRMKGEEKIREEYSDEESIKFQYCSYFKMSAEKALRNLWSDDWSYEFEHLQDIVQVAEIADTWKNLIRLILKDKDVKGWIYPAGTADPLPADLLAKGEFEWMTIYARQVRYRNYEAHFEGERIKEVRDYYFRLYRHCGVSFALEALYAVRDSKRDFCDQPSIREALDKCFLRSLLKREDVTAEIIEYGCGPSEDDIVTALGAEWLKVNIMCRKIQRAWKARITNPEDPLCVKRLLREFTEMQFP